VVDPIIPLKRGGADDLSNLQWQTVEEAKAKDRRHLAELLARQRNPDRPAKKNPPTAELTPKPATMSNKEFLQHIELLLARQRNEDQPPVEKKPPKPEPSKLPAVREKKPSCRQASGSATRLTVWLLRLVHCAAEAFLMSDVSELGTGDSETLRSVFRPATNRDVQI
jgi:hypothetical protein